MNEEMDNLIKKLKASKMASELNDLFVDRFYDHNSNKMLDEKIAILQRCLDGENIMEIGLHILEKMPKDKNCLWDL